MSFIDEYINRKIKQNSKLEKEFEQIDHDLKAAVMTENLNTKQVEGSNMEKSDELLNIGAEAYRSGDYQKAQKYRVLFILRSF